MKKSLLLLFLLLPINIYAYNIPLTINSNGSVSYTYSRSTLEDVPNDSYISNTYELNGNNLLLKSTDDKYYIDSSIELNISSNVNVNIQYLYTNNDLYISSEHDMLLNSINDTTNSKKVTIEDTFFTEANINKFFELEINGCSGELTRYIADYDVTGSISISDSTLTFQSITAIKSFNLINSSFGNNGSGAINGEDASFNIEDSTFDFSYLNPLQKTAKESSIKNSTLKNGTIMSNEKTTINANDCTMEHVSLNYLIFNADNCILNILPNFCKSSFKDCDITIYNTVNVVGFNLDNCIVNTNYRLATQTFSGDLRNDTFIFKDSEIHVNSLFEFLFSAYTYIDNTTITSLQLNIMEFKMKDSTIETGDIYINHNELFEDGSLIENSTIKSKNFYMNNGGDYKIINSTIESTSFYSSYHARVFLDKSKITSHDRTRFRLGSFNHSYVFTDMSDHNNDGVVNTQLLNYSDDVSYIATDLDNNILEPHIGDYCYNDDPSACINAYFTEYPLVLIRDKINIKFKIVNGTWENGSLDDIEYELYSFDKLSNDQIPTNMIAKDGYENGSWDSELIYDELNDDYVFTYSFKKKGIVESVKGVIEELKENPKTGVFRYSFITLLLLCISILVYRKLTFNRYFKYK